MGPDLGLKEMSKTAVKLVSSGKEHCTVNGSRQKYKCVESSDGKSQSKEVNIPDNIADMDVDIIECRGPDEGVFGDDSTENSSSFGDSECGVNDGSSICDTEVQSQEYCEVSGSGLDGFEEVQGIRKRKLTDQWRMFIQPLRWRCKWLELHLIELRRQKMKYERQLAVCNEQKQFKTSALELEGVNSVLQSFHCDIDLQKKVRRRKRKQGEESDDIATYKSKHSLFSYYGSRKLNLVGPLMSDDSGNLDNKETNGNEVVEPVQFKDNSSEPILHSIEMLQSKVHALKARIDKVLSENHIQFSLARTLDFLVVPNDTPAGSRDSLKHGDKFSLRSLNDSQHVTAVSSHGEGTCLPDIIESLRQQIANLHDTTEEEILIDNETAREALRDIEQLLLPVGKTQSEVETAKAVQYVTPEAPEFLAVIASDIYGQPNSEIPAMIRGD